jgi:hypothetical protein
VIQLLLWYSCCCDTATVVIQRYTDKPWTEKPWTDKPWTDKPWTRQTLDTTNPGQDKPRTRKTLDTTEVKLRARQCILLQNFFTFSRIFSL